MQHALVATQPGFMLGRDRCRRQATAQVDAPLQRFVEEAQMFRRGAVDLPEPASVLRYILAGALELFPEPRVSAGVGKISCQR